MTSPSSLILRKHDRVVFLGDSITEQQLYTNYVETYLSLRFPELKLTFFNAGWGGDTAPGAVQRMDRDVLSLEPNVVTVCFGMNDGAYGLPSETIRTTFVNGMRELVRRLKAAGVRVVLLTPGMADETVAPNLAAVHYNRQGLRLLADEVLKLAAEESLPAADLHQLMNEVDGRAKAAVPGYCMIPDGVHPEPAGHLVMAHGVLQALGVPPYRQAVSVDLRKKKTECSPGIRVRKVRKTLHGFTLDLRLDSRPFFVEPAARKVLPFLDFQETFNDLKFAVHGLPTGRGYFRSETLRSASISKSEFEAGINLFSLWSLQVMRESEALHGYTTEKDQIYFKVWRNLSLHGMNSSRYHAAAHAAGIRLMRTLEQGRARLFIGKAGLTCSLNVVTTESPGEPLMNGEFISLWSLLGPFPKPYEKDGLNGEAAFGAHTVTLGREWIAHELDLVNAGMNLTQAFGPRMDCFIYAVTLIHSPVAQTAELLLGSDDGIAAWVNGTCVCGNLTVSRGLAPDQERIPVTLREGTNVLLLKVTQGGGGWGMCARFSGLQKPVVAQHAPYASAGRQP